MQIGMEHTEMDGGLGFAHKPNLGMGVRVRGILSGDCRLAEEVLFLDRPTVRMSNNDAQVSSVFRPDFAPVEDTRFEKHLGVLHEVNHKVGVDR